MQIDRIPSDTHEQVLRCHDAPSGLIAYIAVHDTTLGPALGGCRMWRYDDEDAALADVLRLSEGMTAKAALADLPLGGGKAVILGDPHEAKTEAKLLAFGRFLDTFGGAYISAEDVGMTPADMDVIASETRHVVGRTDAPFGSGDPSPTTADLILRCMRVAARQRLGADLAGLRVSVQGLGHVGLPLAESLARAGARLTACDMHSPTLRNAADLGARIVEPDGIVEAEADIFAPCALGGVLDDRTVPRLAARIVCGSANNQLATPAAAARLHERGVLYCPDYVVNSGGLINVAAEALGISEADWVERQLGKAEASFADLLRRAAREGDPPVEIADRMVADILRAASAAPPWRASR
jgi:leucine dehydrogenase